MGKRGGCCGYMLDVLMKVESIFRRTIVLELVHRVVRFHETDPLEVKSQIVW